MKKGNWTAEQESAIEFRGQLLLAAAAGSGKTAVLVERLLRRITDPDEAVDVDRFLVVTFTKAAAGEMKDRIGKALDDALFQTREAPEIERLLHQRALLQRASITTIHAFCLDLVRKYFYRLELDPSFRVADQAEGDMLCQDVLEELFEEKYETGDPAFLRLADAFGSDRDDQGLQECVWRLYNFASSQPDPETWLKELEGAYIWQDEESLLSSPWGQAVRHGLRDQVQECIALLKRAERISGSTGGPVLYGPVLEDDIRRTELLQSQTEEGQWAEIQEWLEYALEFTRLPAIRSPKAKKDALLAEDREESGFNCIQEADSKTLRDSCRKLREEAKKKLNALNNEVFAYPLEVQISDLKEMGEMAHNLGSLAWSLNKAYEAAKKRRCVLDFSDLEHFALRLLTQEGEASLLALNLREYFTEVLVDEYQDINPVQERILELVSRQTGSSNLFMVGDVKQSIYRFRMSDPGLFLAKYRTLPHWSPQTKGEEPSEGMVLNLNRNFRSRREIVEGINFLFRHIMTEEVGELVYDEQATLQYGASFLSGQGQISTAEGPIEVHLIDAREIKRQSAETACLEQGADEEQGTDEENDVSEEILTAEDLDDTKIEARLVGERIRGLVEGMEFQIFDKQHKDFRPIRYADIVVLMRSYSNAAPVYAEEFQAAGIPVYAETNRGYFSAGEVETMLSLLKIIDNPHQDIPLAAVLRSPLAGLNGSELGKLRLMLPDGDFYEALALAVLAGNSDEAEDRERDRSEVREPDESADRKEKAGRKGSENEENRENNIMKQVLNFYEASLEIRLDRAKKILTETPELRMKTSDFWKKLQGWRRRARRSSLAELLWHLYEETGYLSYVGTLPAGPQRQANLWALYERAGHFEESGYRGLFRFLRFLERFQEQIKDMGNARPLGETEDVVRLMTVHASKGLEFPVVFVAGLGRKFNNQSLRGDFLLHASLGLGLPFIDAGQRVRCPSLIQYALRQRLQQESFAEELRILYVAVTRAEERLFLYGNVDNLEKTIRFWQDNSGSQGPALPDGLLRSAKCFLDWIGPALARHPGQVLGAANFLREGKENQDSSGLEQSFELKDDSGPNTGSHWSVRLHTSFGTGAAGDTLVNLEEKDFVEGYSVERHSEDGFSGKTDSGKNDFQQENYEKSLPEEKDVQHLFAEIRRRLDWQYPRPLMAGQAAKASVTELKRQLNWSADETASRSFQDTSPSLWNRPKFLQDARPLTPAERGTALHAAVQHIPFAAWSDFWPKLSQVEQLQYTADFVSGLEKREVLSREQMNSLQPSAIARFLNTQLGERFFHAREILREIPFTLSLPLAEIKNIANMENIEIIEKMGFACDENSLNILIQGVIDVVLLNRDERGDLWAEVVDYKTDSLRNADGRTGGKKADSEETCGEDTREFQPEQILWQRYGFQISVYALAVERLLRARVCRCTLYAFSLDREISWSKENGKPFAAFALATEEEIRSGN